MVMVVMMVMMMMWMHMAVVMMRGFGALVSAEIWSAPTLTFHALGLFSRSTAGGGTFLCSTRAAYLATLPMTIRFDDAASNITVVGMPRRCRAQTRWRQDPISAVTTIRAGRTNTRSKTGKHATKLRLDSRVVSARTDMSRLRTLNRLWQR
jgi:hypothetical protein